MNITIKCEDCGCAITNQVILGRSRDVEIEIHACVHGQRYGKVVWNSVEDSLPNNLAHVLVCIKDGKYRGIDVADYIAPRKVLAEDYLHDDCQDDFAEYDEEKDCHWTPSGFYQSEYFTDMNYHINQHVTHWKLLPQKPEILCTEEKEQPSETK